MAQPSAVALRLAQAIRAGTWRCPEDWAQEIDYALRRAWEAGRASTVAGTCDPVWLTYPGADAVLGEQ
jgi:hypothetical protein